MSAKSQKALKITAIIILAIVAVVFIILYFTGRLDEFLEVTSNPSENSSSVTESLPQSEQFAVSLPDSSAVQSVQSSSSHPQSTKTESEPIVQTVYRFRNQNLLDQHYEKHGRDMGFKSAEEYEKAASAVPNDPAALHKTEKEDGDDVYYIESTNEFVVVSTDGYIRTYFNPDRGIDYFNKQ